MPRGGRRAGRPGAKYPQRSDLALAPRTAPTIAVTGQPYGSQADRQALQSTVSAAAETRAVPNVPPPEPVDLDAPTRYPDRPVTAGLPVGPGPGPEVLGIPTLTPLQRMKRMYRANPNPDLLQLIILASDGFDE